MKVRTDLGLTAHERGNLAAQHAKLSGPNPFAPEWKYIHRIMHKVFKAGKVPRLDVRTSERFAAEFEAAVEQRGQKAAKAARR